MVFINKSTVLVLQGIKLFMNYPNGKGEHNMKSIVNEDETTGRVRCTLGECQLEYASEDPIGNLFINFLETKFNKDVNDVTRQENTNETETRTDIAEVPNLSRSKRS